MPQLAREALEEMRLSVRGLAGRPVRLDDALADWRAEIIGRLAQAKIETTVGPIRADLSYMLPARLFMQTTRVLREAVSNIIKHSGASHCEVRCTVEDRSLVLTVHDNGKGIADSTKRPRAGHVEHEAARQEDARPVPGRVAARGTVP